MMSSIHGSSRIQNTSVRGTIEGPEGPTGPIGPIGNTGNTGNTGATGNQGLGITHNNGVYGITGPGVGTFGGGTIIFTIDSGVTFGVTGAMGATGAISGENGEPHQNFSILNSAPEYNNLLKSNTSGGTSNFRTLTVSGRDITIEDETAYDILLRGATYAYGIMGNTGELLYIYDGISSHGAANAFWDNNNNTLKVRLSVIREDIGGINYQNTTNSSNIMTASGITGEVVPFTNISTNSNNETTIQPGFHMGVSGGSDIIKYTFNMNTHDTVYSSEHTSVMGSCCYCRNSTVDELNDFPGCIDYVTQDYCNNVGGVFEFTSCLGRPEGPNCYSDGACCVNDICAETSLNKCRNVYGGFFIENQTCSQVEMLGGCPEPCEQIGACCIEGNCFEMSETACSFEINSVFFENSTCEQTNCCIEGLFGACCVDEVCFETSPSICTMLTSADGSNGIFWGVGSSCAGPHRNTGAYAPFDCIWSAEYSPSPWDGVTGGVNSEMICIDVDGDPLLQDGEPITPPCPSCHGWQQYVGGECNYPNSEIIDNICKCPEYAEKCGCDPEQESCSPVMEDSDLQGCIGTCCSKKTGEGWSCEQTSRIDCAKKKEGEDTFLALKWSGCDAMDMCSNNYWKDDNELICDKLDEICTGQDEEKSPDVMILMDTSIEIFKYSNDINPALSSFVDKLYPQYEKIGLNDTDFTDTGVNVSLTRNYAIVKEGIYNMSIGSNRLSRPLDLIKQDFLTNAQGTDHEKIIVIISNGNMFTDAEKNSTRIKAGELKDQGYIIYSIGLNTPGVPGMDTLFMSELASGNDYFAECKPEELKTVINQLGHMLSCGGEDVFQDLVRQSFGTIILSDGTCWECCCDHTGSGLAMGSGSTNMGIVDLENMACCNESGYPCPEGFDTSTLMTTCCWWQNEGEDAQFSIIGRSCEIPGERPWLNAQTQCTAMLHGTSISEGTCEDVNIEGCCCFPDDWTLPDDIDWLQDVDDWRIPDAGDCIVQGWSGYYAHQMNEIRCDFFGGCWVDNGVCNGGEYGGECPEDNSC